MRLTPRALAATVAAAVAAVALAVPGAAAEPVRPDAPVSHSPPLAADPLATAMSLELPFDGLRRGDRGPAVRALQQRLADLGYWMGGGVTGVYGLLTQQAVLAFQKVDGLPRTGTVDEATRQRLDTARRPTPRSATGDLLEIDKARQVLFVVRDGRVAWTINTSTGTERRYGSRGRTEVADTPEGRWVVDRAVAGVRRTALGTLYRPRYFHRDGIAIHGARDVPAWPASHGCARVTNAAMDWIWRADVAPIGSTVWIY